MLDSYGWVDKNAGVVRIPIDEAMKLTLERGLPARPSRSDDSARCQTQRTPRTQSRRSGLFVSSVSFVSFVLQPPSAAPR